MEFDEWGDVGVGEPLYEAELVHSRLTPLVVSIFLCGVSFALLFIGDQLHKYGYFVGLFASTVAFFTMLGDRKRQVDINFSQTFPVAATANYTRAAATVISFIHIVLLAREAGGK
jgi:hypothetical protein